MNPILDPFLGFLPSPSAVEITLPYSIPAWSMKTHTHRQAHTHTHTHSKTLSQRFTQSLSGPAWSCSCSLSAAKLIQPGWEIWGELVGEHVDQRNLSAMTWYISSHFTMELVRVWSKYQGVVLITSMMFMQGRSRFPTAGSALHVMLFIIPEQFLVSMFNHCVERIFFYCENRVDFSLRTHADILLNMRLLGNIFIDNIMHILPAHNHIV